MTGYAVEEFYARSPLWLEDISVREHQSVMLAWHRHLAGENFDCQYQLSADNGDRWFHSRFIYLRDATGENTGVVGMVTDITAQKLI